MNEMLLQFIWQYSLYNPTALFTNEGEKVTVIFPGRRNTNAGPDFEEAKIKIGSTTFVGNVELHVLESEWTKHGHQWDKAYQNIILHVVYKRDLPSSTGVFPTLEIGSHIPAHVVEQYTNLIQTTQPIACASQHGQVAELIKTSWLNRLLAERWEHKLSEWEQLLDELAGDWRNLLYWRMAANFGFRVNATPFLMLARSLPLNILGRHRENLLQIEALIFGQAGMLLTDLKDDYSRALQKEYHFLQKKYQLHPVPAHLWKFLRMRPANFPSLRLAQFAALIHRSLHLFSKMIQMHSVKEISQLLEVTASPYWDTHYRLDSASSKQTPKSLGQDAIHNIIINTVAPVQFLYAHAHGDYDLQEQALQLLSAVPAERNRYITLWEEKGWKAANAAETQALLQLFHSYCAHKKCLECAIGLHVVRNPKLAAEIPPNFVSD